MLQRAARSCLPVAPSQCLPLAQTLSSLTLSDALEAAICDVPSQNFLSSSGGEKLEKVDLIVANVPDQ